MAIPVLMPRQGQSVESCILGQWHKTVGEKVSKGDILFSYETDKASFEEEIKEDGILLAVFYEEGDEILVLTNVAVIGKKGESVDEFNPNVASATETKTADKEESAKKNEIADDTPKVVEFEVENDIANKRIRISPLAKNIARKQGLDVESIKGTGPHGRIIARDIEAATKLTTKVAKSATVVKVPKTVAVSMPAITTNDEFEIKPISNMRKLIASAMQNSLQNSAQLTHHMSADVTKLLAFREKVKAAMKSRALMINISMNSMLCHCIIKALKKHPEVNSHFLGNSIKTFNKVHLGIAIDTKNGLMVPTLKNADDLSIIEFTQQVEALSKAAIKREINPDLLASDAASFSISNLEGYGVEMFTPVVNLPQVAILGINAIQLRPIDTGKGNIEFIPHIGLSLSYDHRALDGGPATMFLRSIKQQIERFEQTVI